MLKNEDIICVSSIDWDFIWQGHQEIMTRMARAGNRILYIENTGVRMPALRDFGRIRSRLKNWKSGIHGIRKIEEGLYVYSPIVLPFPYLKLARWINKKMMFSVLFRWLKAVGFKEPIVWAFLPTGLSNDLIEKIEPKALIYYCIDSFQASSKEAEKIKNTEKVMIERADLVFATARELVKHCSQYSKNVHYFPFGVNIDNFTAALSGQEDGSVSADLDGLRRPIAGYIGGIHKWVDQELVKFIAEKNSDISFVFCGPIQTDISDLKALPNVKFLGQKKTRELPYYVKEFDVCLIPYKIAEYTKNVYPTKLNEYLSLGKAVVSTALPEVVAFNSGNNSIVRIASSKEEFSDKVKRSAAVPMTKDESAIAMQAAKKNSWSDRVEKMSALIDDVTVRKAKEREGSWKDNLAGIYRSTRRKAIPALVIAAILYFAIFRTSLVWYLAEPLKISDVPARADVIVALGGGVGESGKVGQGHEERAQTAVRLYKEGLSDRILYMSGYRYLMKEAEVMKALSIFTGVNGSDILMDDRSLNTYEMSRSLKEMAYRNGWRSAILISSPYHLKRVKLLCDKNLKDIRISYVPVDKSAFFEHKDGPTWSQFKAIACEYLAIVYYKLKGYI